MTRVAVKFRGDVSGIISADEALKISELFAKYQETRQDVILDLAGGKRVRISNLETMEDVKEPEQTPLPIIEAMQQSVEEEKDPKIQTLKEAQLKIFSHNKRCIAEGKMADFIWYYLENGKLIKSTKEIVGARVQKVIRKQLMAKPEVKGTVERDGIVSVVMKTVSESGMFPRRAKR